MSKRFRADEAATRLGLPAGVMDSFVAEGMIQPCETIAGENYFRQDALDRLIHSLHSRLQRASWRDMEDRMEDVEARLTKIEAELSAQRRQGQHLL